MGNKELQKGKAFERRVAAALRTATGQDCHRGLQFDGPRAPDVVAPGLWVECKKHKKPSPEAALAQAEREAAEAGSVALPVAITAADRQQPIVTMRAATLCELAAGNELRASRLTVRMSFADFLVLYSIWEEGCRL